MSHCFVIQNNIPSVVNCSCTLIMWLTIVYLLILQDGDVVSKCLRALQGLASYHYKETAAGRIGLGAHATGLKDSSGSLQEGLLSLFLRSLLQLLLFEDYRWNNEWGVVVHVRAHSINNSDNWVAVTWIFLRHFFPWEKWTIIKVVGDKREEQRLNIEVSGLKVADILLHYINTKGKLHGDYNNFINCHQF